MNKKTQEVLGMFDLVRQRHRKLFRFVQSLTRRFLNAAELPLDKVDLSLFINALVETGHFFIYTGVYERHGIYILGDPQLFGRTAVVRQLLTRCFVTVSATSPQIATGVNTDAVGTEAIAPPAYDHNDPRYLLVLTPRDPFMWTGAVMNIEVPEVDFDIRDRRIRIVTASRMRGLDVAVERIMKLFPMFTTVPITKKVHLGGVNRELKKAQKAAYKLSDAILKSPPRLQQLIRHRPGYDSLLAIYYYFAAEIGLRSASFMEGTQHARFHLALMRFSIEWVAFICDDCVPSDSRTFKWAVNALEFAMMQTEGENIMHLNTDDFELLRDKVASCMALLISHFDILGARSSFEAKKEKEQMEIVKMANKAAAKLLGGIDTTHHQQGFGGIEPLPHQAGTNGSVSALSSMRLVRDRWTHHIAEVDARRKQIETDMRLAGRILDEVRPEDKSLVFLAGSTSNIQIRWQQGDFIGGGTFGSVYLGVNLDSGDVMAVKELRFQDLASAPALIKQVRDEMTVMEMLKHPNIVDYYGIEVHRDKVYIFEEYCQGGSLGNLLDNGRIEDEGIIQYFAVQMLDGLAYLHSQNVVHRDIKPDSESGFEPVGVYAELTVPSRSHRHPSRQEWRDQIRRFRSGEDFGKESAYFRCTVAHGDRHCTTR